MGATSVRCGLYNSVGTDKLRIEPEAGVFSQEAFDVADYAVFAAQQCGSREEIWPDAADGLRYIMFLVDNYEYSAGGRNVRPRASTT